MGSDYHTPVLVQEVLEFLMTKRNGVYVDATVGGGGHAEHILRQCSPRGRLVGLDVDADAIAFTGRRLGEFSDRLTLVRANFSRIRPELLSRGIQSVDGILFDLGVSSFQLDEPGKGFSFQHDGQLDMRMDRRQLVDAAKIVNGADETELRRIFREYGEERLAGRITVAIARQRARTPILTTGVLAGVVKKAVGGRYLTKSLARVFQALRIAVNNELENLRTALGESVELLHTGGRIVVLSYHSLEDRIVKKFFAAEALTVNPSPTKLSPGVPRTARLRILTRKPVGGTAAEITENPRARSAKLRVAERI